MKTYKIGRNPDNDIIINDENRTVSGYHALLKVNDNGTMTICDKSTNGTTVNAVKITKDTEVIIRKGDDIRFAKIASLDWRMVDVPTTTGNNATVMDNSTVETYSIGTASDNQIVIADTSNYVSRHHAVLTKKADGRFYITDQSTNGTFVNGVIIKSNIETQVRINDNISFANVRQLDWSLIVKSAKTVMHNNGTYKNNTPPPPPSVPFAPEPRPEPTQEMFSDPFSFEGRIRRLELNLSMIIYTVIALIVNLIGESGGFMGIVYLAYIPMLWFNIAQCVKRCHDRGNSGWYLLIPLYGLWLLFGDSDPGDNEYGRNPKGN